MDPHGLKTGYVGELPAVPASDHRRTAKKLAEAGRWVEAVHEAQEAHTLDDALLLRAITGLAEEVLLSVIKLGLVSCLGPLYALHCYAAW